MSDNQQFIYESAARLKKSDAGRNALRALDMLFSGESLDMFEEEAIETLMLSEKSGYAGTARDAVREALGKEAVS